MDQLYEAMPIPSSDDDDNVNQHDVVAHCRSRTVSDLDVSAHGSFTESSCSSSVSQNSEQSDDASVGAKHNAHHRVFTTASSPQELFCFLVELLELAEQLNQRLMKIAPDQRASLHHSPSVTLTPPQLQQANKRDHGEGTVTSSMEGGNNQNHGLAALANNTREVCANYDSPLHHAFIDVTTCHGIAKLRNRLRKETENLRRTVEGLRNAGCTGIIDRDTHSDRAAAASNSTAISPALFNAAVSGAQCNSFAHFEGVVTCLERERHVTGVYVPVSGHIGPLQCRTSAAVALSAHQAQNVSKPTVNENVCIEVDVVSNDGHRWIKVKTATSRNLELEAAALELNGATPFTDMLLALCARAKLACLPHRRTAHVAVVLLNPPPLSLRAFFESHDVAWVSLTSSKPIRAHQLSSPLPPSPSSAWLPPLSMSPQFICLDTTALVTLCSQSCYADATPLPVRLERLAPYHVLQEQQRKEAVECAAVAAIMEPALRLSTRWCTREEVIEGMRQALLREDDAVQKDATVIRSVELSRAAQVPSSLVEDVDLSWLPPLQQVSEQRRSDGADTGFYTQSSTSPDESQLLKELSDLQALDGTRRPNWIVADITYEEFRWILETIAGPEEIARATRLLKLITVVDTGFLRDRMRVERRSAASGHQKSTQADTAFTKNALSTPSSIHVNATEALYGERKGALASVADTTATFATPTPSPLPPPLFTSVEYLRLSGRVSLRNKIVFGLADAVDAVILTSNVQLCHAAREQGVCVEACFHPSRSLTEQKLYQLPRRHGPDKPPAIL